MFGDSVVQEAETSRRNREFQRMQAAAAVRTQRKGNNTTSKTVTSVYRWTFHPLLTSRVLSVDRFDATVAQQGKEELDEVGYAKRDLISSRTCETNSPDLKILHGIIPRVCPEPVLTKPPSLF
jgi:hypothetical protein